MSDEKSQSNCGSSHGYRADLDGRLPIVYNGKSAEEWYTLYCQETLRLARLQEAARAVVELEVFRVNANGGEPYDPIANPGQFDFRLVKLANVIESR